MKLEIKLIFILLNNFNLFFDKLIGNNRLTKYNSVAFTKVKTYATQTFLKTIFKINKKIIF